MRCLVPLALSSLLGLASAPALGFDCFCVVAEDDVVLFECREQRRPLSSQPLIFCTDLVTGEQRQIPTLHGMRRVPDGEPPCTPCRLADAACTDPICRVMRALGNDEKGEQGPEDADTGEAGAEPDAASTNTEDTRL